MAIRLICLDFDGTIMAYEPAPASFHAEVIGLLNELGARGIAWCANSGRDMEDQQQVLSIAAERGLRHWPEALLCTESMIYPRRNGVYDALQPWNGRVEAELRAFHRQVQSVLESRMEQLVQRYASMPVYLGETYTAFNVPGDESRSIALYEELHDLLEGLPGLMVTRNGGWVAVLIERVGKGNVLREYARYAGYGPSEILAVGDQFNDLPMLDGNAARHVGCPGNSIPEVMQSVRTAGGYVAVSGGPEGTMEVIRRVLDG
jgi:HAD superfamily hydrolase (TIGR01484 family)